MDHTSTQNRVNHQAAIFDVAARLGAHLKRIGPSEYAGPCLVCGGRDRFSVNTAKGVFNCRHCAVGGDAIQLVRHANNVSYAEAVEFVAGEAHVRPYGERRQAPPPAPTEASPDPEKIAVALSLWLASAEPRGTVAERYLNSRGLALADDIAGRVLRFHPGINAMLGLFRNVRSGQPQAISRTFIDANARKIERKFLGPTKDAAIMLDAVAASMTVGEGIETALTARAIGLGPTWATGSAGTIGTLPLVAGVKRLRILVERDANGASAKAATACAKRWGADGRDVQLRLPPLGCKDLNDSVRGDR